MTNPWEENWAKPAPAATEESGPWSDYASPNAKDESGDVGRGFKVALGQTVPLAKGAVGLAGATAEKAFGEGGVSTAVKNWGLHGYQEGMQKLQPLSKDTDELTTAWDRAKQGDLGALVDWAQYGLGYAAGQAAQAGATALAGAAVGTATAGPAGTLPGAVAGAAESTALRTAAQRVIGGLVAKEAAKLAEQQVVADAAKAGLTLTAEQIAAQAAERAAAPEIVKLATANAARSVGQTVGLTGYAGVQEAGSIYPEAEQQAAQEGRQLTGADLARVWATTAGAAALEGVTDKLGLEALTGKVKIGGPGGTVSRAVTGGLVAGGAEAATEAAQTGLERVGAGQSLTDESAIKDYINSAALGAVGGAPVGALGGAMHRTAAPTPSIVDIASAPTVEDAIVAAEAASGSMDEILDRHVSNQTRATDAYLGVTPAAEQSPAAPETRAMGAELAPAMDRQAELAQAGAVAPTALDRQLAQEQATTALQLASPPATRTTTLTSDNPFDSERAAKQRAAVLRYESASVLKDGASYDIVPHPAAPGKFAIQRTSKPEEPTVAPAQQMPEHQVQNRIEASAMVGDKANRQSEDAGRQAVITAALKRVEERGGVASPAEAQIFREANLGQPYDKVDYGLAPQGTEAQKLTAATGIEIAGNAPRSNVRYGADETAAQRAELEARNQGSFNALNRGQEQQRAALAAENAAVAQKPQTQAKPPAQKVMDAARVEPALRTADQLLTLDTAQRAYTAEEFNVLTTGARAPFQLSSSQRVQLAALRGETKASAPRPQSLETLAKQTGPTTRLADLRSLPKQSAAKKGELSSQAYATVKNLARVFGKNVLVFESDDAKAADGYVDTRRPDTIYLNRNSSTPHLVVFGHELMHSLKVNNPEAYDAVEKVIKLKEGANTDVPGVRGDMEELTSDLLGNRFREPAFWADVFRQITEGKSEAEARQVTTKLAAAIMRVVNATVKALTGAPGFKTDDMVANLEEVRAALKNALANYAVERKSAAVELEKTEQGPAAARTEPANSGFANPENTPSVSEKRAAATKAARQEMGFKNSEKRELPNGIVIRPTENGYQAVDAEGKKVGYLNSNLTPAQSKALDETANIDIVKVDNSVKGQGVGAALYAQWFKDHEGRVAPSGKTTADAWKVWKRDYPEKVTAFVKQEAARLKGGGNRSAVLDNITDPDVKRQVLEASSAVRLSEKRASQEDFTPDRIGNLLNKNDWAILTAENPKGEQASAEYNSTAQAKLRKDLDVLGAKYKNVEGHYGQKENSLAVTGITEEQATALGKKYDQDSVLTNKGLIYQDGSITPATGVVTLREAPEDFYSKIGDTLFRVDLDFDTKLNEPTVKQSAKREQLDPDVVAALGRHIRSLTPEERAKMRVGTAKRLVDQIESLPSAKEMAAVAYAGRAKRGWYENSARALEHVFGADAPRFAALLAALSPQVSVQSNLYNALSTWKNWIADGRPTTREEITDTLAKSVQGGRGRGSVLDAWINNSVRALSAEDPSKVVLSGPKVNSFMKNLVGYTDEVTNDAWMSNYALVDQTMFSGKLNAKGTDPGKGTGYLAMSARVREAARELTKLTGEEWTPAEVQETIWSWAKTIYEKQASAGEERGAKQLVLDKAITAEMINATPDFRTLFHDDVNENLLRAAGYDEQLSSLRGREDLGGASQQEPRAEGETAPFAASAQERYELRAAERLEELYARSRGLKASENRNTFDGYTPAQAEAAQKVFAQPKDLTVKERWDALRHNFGLRATQALVDQFAPIAKLDQQAYVQARMSKASDSTLEATLLYGKPFMNGGLPDVDIKDKGFAQVLADLKGEHDRFLQWVAAQRADRLKSLGLENLFGDGDIAALKSLNQGKMEDGSSRPAAYAKALQSLNEFNDAVLKVAEDSGLIDTEARQLFKDVPYVPFYRVMEDNDGPVGPKFSSGLVNQYTYKKLKGGTQQLNGDLLANTLLNWSHLFQAAAKNRAAVASLKAAVATDVAYEVPSGTKGAVKVLENGETKHYAVEDPYLLDAITAVNYTSPEWVKPLSTMKRWLTTSVTANPAFKIRNLIRDSVSAVAQSDLDPNVFSNLAKGWRATAKDSQTYASMMASGGLMRFGSSVEGDSAHRAHEIIRHLDGEVLDEQGSKALWTKVRDTFEAYQELGDRSEQVNRAALYEQLKAKGYSHADASFMARDLLDFSMSGSAPVVRFLTQSVPFLNARLQGLYKLGRAAKENPQKFWAVTGAVALASLALYAAYHDDKDWKKREDWDRDTYWWFKIGDKAFRIPKPFEVGAIGTLAERTAELMFEKEMTKQRYGQRLSNMAMQTFAMDPTPQVIKPLLDVYANKDSFTGRPIEGPSLEKLRPEDRFDQNTSMTARMLGQLGLPNPADLAKGQWTPLSPKQIDFLTRGYFGWVGATSLAASDYVLRPMAGEGEKAEKQLKDLFVVGSFVEGLPTNSSRYVTAMYDQIKAIEEAHNSLQAAVKSGDVERAQEIAKDEKSKLQKYHISQQLKRREAEINAMIRRTQASKTLTAETKREMLDRFEQLRGSIAEGMPQ